MSLENLEKYQYDNVVRVSAFNYSGNLAVDLGSEKYTVSGNITTPDTAEAATDPVIQDTLDNEQGDAMKFNFEFEVNLSDFPTSGDRNLVKLPGLMEARMESTQVLFNFPWLNGRWYYAPAAELITGWNKFKLSGDGNQVLFKINNGSDKELANESTAITNKWYQPTSGSQYFLVDQAVDFSKFNSWEVQAHITWVDNDSVTQTLFGPNGSYIYYKPALVRSGTKFGLRVNSDSSTTIVSPGDSLFEPENGKEYWIKCGWTGTTYYLDYKLNGATEWTRAQEVASTTKSYNSGTWRIFSASAYSSSYWYNGKCDMNHFKFYADNELWIDGSRNSQYYISYENHALAENGTIGGDNFAAESSSQYSTSYAAWYAFNKTVPNKNTNNWRPSSAPTTANPQWITYYCPTAMTATSFAIDNTSTATRGPGNCIFQGSNDNQTWTDLLTFEHTVTTSYERTTYNIPSASQGAYKYYRLYVTSCQYSSMMLLGELTLFFTTGASVPVSFEMNGTIPYTDQVIGVYYPSLSLGQLQTYQSWLHLKNIKAIKVED